MDEHPGGDDVLLAVTGTLIFFYYSIITIYWYMIVSNPSKCVVLEGKDATDEFEDAGHSKTARELMEEYFIGELDEDSVQEIPELKIYKKEEPKDAVQKLVDLTKQYWVVPVSVITISVAVSVLFSRKK